MFCQKNKYLNFRTKNQDFNLQFLLQKIMVANNYNVLQNAQDLWIILSRMYYKIKMRSLKTISVWNLFDKSLPALFIITQLVFLWSLRCGRSWRRNQREFPSSQHFRCFVRHYYRMSCLSKVSVKTKALVAAFLVLFTCSSSNLLWQSHISRAP